MFDFDATLPFMALQFLLLSALLNAIFYKPMMKALDDRDNYIRTNKVDARERLDKSERLIKEYEQQLANARKQSQLLISEAEAEAQQVYASRVAEAQQKQAALSSLEQQVDSLSHQILGKLLGPGLAR
jgi:F-type H+-transporting ATPase subunit b